MKIIGEVEHGERTVNGRTVAIREIIWKDGGRSFEVWEGDEELTESTGSFDEMPTDEALARFVPPWWFCPLCGARYSEGDEDCILDHLRDKHGM
jgi:hypothetical protein